jgi:hypothetical protein
MLDEDEPYPETGRVQDTGMSSGDMPEVQTPVDKSACRLKADPYLFKGPQLEPEMNYPARRMESGNRRARARSKVTRPAAHVTANAER